MKRRLYRTEAEITQDGIRIAHNLLEDYPELAKQPSQFLAVPILQGGMTWSQDILRPLADKGIHIPSFPLMIDGRYPKGTKGKKQIKILAAPKKKEVKGKQILVIEDIIDQGRTLQQILQFLSQLTPANIIVTAMCEKTPFREVEIPEANKRHIGFRYTGKKWFIGHGMDVGQLGRYYRDLYLIEPLR